MDDETNTSLIPLLSMICFHWLLRHKDHLYCSTISSDSPDTIMDKWHCSARALNLQQRAYHPPRPPPPPSLHHPPWNCGTTAKPSNSSSHPCVYQTSPVHDPTHTLSESTLDLCYSLKFLNEQPQHHLPTLDSEIRIYALTKSRQCGWVPFLSTWGYHNIVNWLYSSKKLEVQKVKKIKIFKRN